MKLITGYAMLLALSLPASVHAQEQRIPDLSMSVEDSLRKDDNVGTSTQPLGGTQQPYVNAGSSANNNAPRPAAAGRFMDGYCSGTVAPADGTQSNAQDCVSGARSQLCERFANLPPDAQQLLDTTMACLAKGTSEDENGYLNPQHAAAPDCDDSAKRLQLIQKYWTDANIAYSLVFLPEMFANAAGQCMNGNAGNR